MEGLKRLTQNDLPRSKSHQAGINLPKGSFSDIFEDLFDIPDDIVRKKFSTQWYSNDGKLIVEKECPVAYYRSKGEFRLILLPSDMEKILNLGDMLFFIREWDLLKIIHLPSGSEHLIDALNRSDLLERLP